VGEAPPAGANAATLKKARRKREPPGRGVPRLPEQPRLFASHAGRVYRPLDCAEPSRRGSALGFQPVELLGHSQQDCGLRTADICVRPAAARLCFFRKCHPRHSVKAGPRAGDHGCRAPVSSLQRVDAIRCRRSVYRPELNSQRMDVDNGSFTRGRRRNAPEPISLVRELAGKRPGGTPLPSQVAGVAKSRPTISTHAWS
jgi:hypothetical protein